MKTTKTVALTRGWPVCGGNFKGTIDPSLTHAVDWAAEKVICGRVKIRHLLDDECCPDMTETPTCPVCRARLGLG